MPDTNDNPTPNRRSAALPLAVGALGLAGLGLWNGIPQRHAIESDLGNRAQQALSAQGFEAMSVSFEGSGRDAALRGTPPNGKAVQQAIQAVQQVDGVRTVAYQPPTTVAAPETDTGNATQASTSATVQLKPPAVAAQTSPGSVTLTGTVPSPAQAASLADAAKLSYGEGKVTNKLSVDAGVSDVGLNEMGRLIQALGKDSKATATLREGNLTLTGTVTSEATKTAVDDAAVQVTSEAAKVNNELKVSPATSSSRVTTAAVRTPTAPTLTSNASQPAQSAPGTASREQEILAAQAKFDALPPITFLPAGRQLTPQGIQVLQRAAKILVEHPTVKVRAEGFTDSDGHHKANQGLSLSRAAAVRRHLVSLGVAVSRTGSKGWGEANPVAPNTTEANKAKNRRVELRAW